MAEVVLDASALVALLRNGPGADQVAAVLGRACVSAVNLAEVYVAMAEDGKPHEATAAQVARLGLPVIPFEERQAALVASIWQRARAAGLAFGDVVCVALAMHLGLPALTGEHGWDGCNPPVRVTTLR